MNFKWLLIAIKSSIIGIIFARIENGEFLDLTLYELSLNNLGIQIIQSLYKKCRILLKKRNWI